jgi:hypothetical protein
MEGSSDIPTYDRYEVGGMLRHRLSEEEQDLIQGMAGRRQVGAGSAQLRASRLRPFCR